MTAPLAAPPEFHTSGAALLYLAGVPRELYSVTPRMHVPSPALR